MLRLYYDEAAENPFAYAAYLQALELDLEGPVEIVVAGADGADADALWAEVGRTYLPHRVLVAARPGDRDPLAPARDRPAVGGRATPRARRSTAPRSSS